MTSRSRTLAGLFLATLAVAWRPTSALAQDAPLYRDPNPLEGRRIDGPILSPRAPTPAPMPPPPSGLGPFQDPASASSPASSPVPVLSEPLLGVAPMLPPLPAMIPFDPNPVGGVAIKRTTQIRGPKGMLGHFHDWFRETVFGPPKPSPTTYAPRRGLIALLHGDVVDSPRVFSWPSWPSWPLANGR
jgi:hypothetical protein